MMVPSVGFRTIDEAQPGPKLATVFAERADAYAAWYLQDGDQLRPSAAEGLVALRTHMPELIPAYEAMVSEVGVGDPVAARMFTMWRPPGAAIACSQAVLTEGERGPRLVRNYDYPAELMDAVILRSELAERRVIGVRDPFGFPVEYQGTVAPRDVQRLPKISPSIVCLAQAGLGHDLDVKGVASGGQGEGTLASHNGTVVLAHGREGDAQVAGNPSEPLGASFRAASYRRVASPGRLALRASAANVNRLFALAATGGVVPRMVSSRAVVSSPVGGSPMVHWNALTISCVRGPVFPFVPPVFRPINVNRRCASAICDGPI
jgi:hypothetical protein